MVGRLREKQYQLAAQKRNDAFLKHDCHVRTAKYFQLQNGIAKQYDSWNLKRNVDPKGELERAKKAEKLLLRRNKLRNLLKEEEEIYARELAQVKSRKKQGDSDDDKGTGVLRSKEKLQEKRPLEDKIYPSDVCRRYRSYCNDGTTNSTIFSQKRSSLFSQSDLSSSSNESTKLFPNKKYSARYSRRSLENTNVRGCDYYVPSIVCNNAKPLRETNIEEDKENREETKSPVDDHRCTNWKDSSPVVERGGGGGGGRRRSSNISNNSISNVLPMEGNDERKERQQVPMCPKKAQFYFAQKEVRRNIADLVKRELQASRRQKWAEALRLRDMTNKLELMLEKELYEDATKGQFFVSMNEETRKAGLENIERRQNELAKRENVCTDCTIYSDEAKVLWKKWVQEDDRSVIKEARLRRETLMKELEQDFQNLDVRDKERFARMYENAIRTSSYLHERSNLNSTAVTCSSPSNASSPDGRIRSLVGY